MGFNGRNPYVEKARGAEERARVAGDPVARVAAWREAAHTWERAIKAERDAKKQREYEGYAAEARARAEGGEPEEDEGQPATVDRRALLN